MLGIVKFEVKVVCDFVDLLESLFLGHG